MDVEQLVAGEQRLADEHAEGADAQHVGPRGGDPVEHVGGMQVLGLDDVELEPARPLGDRRRREPAPAALRRVRAGDDQLRAVL